jgi:hypothetical protein
MFQKVKISLRKFHSSPMARNSQSNAHHTFLFGGGGGLWVKTSAGTAAIGTDIFLGFPQFLKAIASISPEEDRDRFLPTLFPVQYSLMNPSNYSHSSPSYVQTLVSSTNSHLNFKHFKVLKISTCFGQYGHHQVLKSSGGYCCCSAVIACVPPMRTRVVIGVSCSLLFSFACLVLNRPV